MGLNVNCINDLEFLDFMKDAGVLYHIIFYQFQADWIYTTDGSIECTTQEVVKVCQTSSSPFGFYISLLDC